MTRPLHITIHTPAQTLIRAGNRVTADRWQAILASLGHRVDVTTAYDGAPADILIAIHAWRSANAVVRFAGLYRERPIIVCLSGTDIYAYQQSHPEVTHATMAHAAALVGLHDLVGQSIPARFRSKLQVIYQSAPALVRGTTAPDAFDACVIGHLRAEKDPFRAALASRLLPSTSRVRITHLGGAMDENWAAQAHAEMAVNPRYRWLGEVPASVVRDTFATARLMVLSSLMEGGANVLGEAIAAHVPVIASAIEGSLGLLGAAYPATYPVGDTHALAQLLQRTEGDPAFLATLTALCAARAPLFAPERERAAWAKLIADVT